MTFLSNINSSSNDFLPKKDLAGNKIRPEGFGPEVKVRLAIRYLPYWLG